MSSGPNRQDPVTHALDTLRDSYATAVEPDLQTNGPVAQGMSLGPADVDHPPGAGSQMLDVIFIVSGIAFFILASAYAEGCDRL